MTIKQSTNKYFNMHIKVFKKSFKLNKPLSQSILEFTEYISLIVLLILFLYTSVRFFIAVLPLFLSLDKITNISDLVTDESLMSIIMQQFSLLDTFLIKTISLLVITALLLSFILAFFNSMIVAHVHKNHWNVHKFLKILLVYAVLTLTYFGAMFAMLYYMLNILLLAILIISLTFIYSYMLLIFQLSIEDISLLKYLKKGLINCIRLHRTIPIIVIGFIVFVLVIVVCAFMALLLKQYVILLLLPLIVLWNIWMLNYQYHILYYIK